MANDYHEPASEMTKKEREIIRAINSFKEEIAAVDWYYQRVAVISLGLVGSEMCIRDSF